MEFFFLPVERIIGMPSFATCSINKGLLVSPDPILRNGTPILFKKHAED